MGVVADGAESLRAEPVPPFEVGSQAAGGLSGGGPRGCVNRQPGRTVSVVGAQGLGSHEGGAIDALTSPR